MVFKELREETFNIRGKLKLTPTSNTSIIQVMSIQDTNSFLKALKPNKSVVIMNLGQAQTIIPVGANVLEYDYMINDYYDITGVNEVTLTPKVKEIIKQSKLIMDNTNKYDYFIIRCDAGASRSQALATALSRFYNLSIKDNILEGNMILLQRFERELGIYRGEAKYREMLLKRFNYIEENYGVFFNDVKDRKVPYNQMIYKEKQPK